MYGRLRNGFYGLETTLVMLVFCARLREPRAEGATRVSLASLGRVLGVDRAPEVKTIRRKLGELAAAGRAEHLQMAIARHHAAARPDQLGFFYIDGHTRAYFGTRDVQKMHVARLKFPATGTEETWVTDGAGDSMLITHALRMAACNAETILARALHGRYARAGDEACALIREALTTSGDITPRDRTLHVRLDPLTAPRRTRALAVLCAQLNDTQTRYPGTTLTLRYEVKEHPGTA